MHEIVIFYCLGFVLKVANSRFMCNFHKTNIIFYFKKSISKENPIFSQESCKLRDMHEYLGYNGKRQQSQNKSPQYI